MISSRKSFNQPVIGGLLSVADSISRRVRGRSGRLQSEQNQISMRNRKALISARRGALGYSARSRFKTGSRTGTKTKTRKRRNYKNKKLFYKRKRYVKRQVKKFRKYNSLTQPYETHVSNSAENWVSTGFSAHGNSNVTSVDVGLCRFPVGPVAGIFNPTFDDLSFALNKCYGITTTNGAELFDGKIYFDKCRAITQIRNNTNIGVHVDVYYCKRKMNNSSSQQDTNVLAQNIIQYQMQYSVVPSDANIYRRIGLSSSVFDYPSVCSKLTFKKHSSFILYPAMTKTFKLRSPIEGKIVNIATEFLRTASPKYHRSLVFVTRGLPVHRSDTLDFAAGPVAYGANSIDVLISRKLKFRRPVLQEQDQGFVPITSIEAISFNNQEIQPAVNPTNALVQS